MAGSAQATRLHHVLAILVMGLCLVVASGCGPAEPEPHDPSLVGVVATRDFLTPMTVRLVLETGESLDLDLKTARNLNPNGDEPDPDELLMYGLGSDRPWFATATRSMDGEFEIRSQPRATARGSIMFESGLRLPIADDFSESLTGPMEAGMPVTYLLNDRGEVFRRP
jgi:hypothetical protein